MLTNLEGRIRMMSYQNTRGGFTLIELLVVIAIIGVLSSVVLVSLDQARARARDAKRISELRQVATALEMYYSDHGSYPGHASATVGTNCGTGRSVWTSMVDDLVPTYLPEIPEDPLNRGNNYCYVYLNGPQRVAERGDSSYHCDGRSRSDYEWSIMFTLESSSSEGEVLPMTRRGSPPIDLTHCLVGGLR